MSGKIISGLQRFVIFLAIMVPVASCIVAIDYAKRNETPQTRREQNCGDAGKIPAKIMAKQFVERRLKAPSTAKFPWLDGPTVTVTGTCEFEIHGYVDAQNSFGGMLRNYYYVSLRYDPVRDNYVLLDIRIGH